MKSIATYAPTFFGYTYIISVLASVKDWLLFLYWLVIVNYENIAKNGQYNFDVLKYETYGLLYDWKSITHYRNKAFRKKYAFGYTIESNVS